MDRPGTLTEASGVAVAAEGVDVGVVVWVRAGSGSRAGFLEGVAERLVTAAARAASSQHTRSASPSAGARRGCGI